MALYLAFLKAVGGGFAGEVACEILPEVARKVCDWWAGGKTPEQRRAEVEALAQARPAEARRRRQHYTAVARPLAAISPGRPPRRRRRARRPPSSPARPPRAPARPAAAALAPASAFPAPCQAVGVKCFCRVAGRSRRWSVDHKTGRSATTSTRSTRGSFPTTTPNVSEPPGISRGPPILYPSTSRTIGYGPGGKNS
jgi:hypothetical protein